MGDKKMTARRIVWWSCAAVLVILFLAVFAHPAEPLVTAESAEPPARGRVCISGVYPHLATFNSVVKNDGETYGSGGECGIGAIVPWACKLPPAQRRRPLRPALCDRLAARHPRV